MNDIAFRRWLAEMKEARLAKTDADCARLLGRHPNAITRMKENGTDQTTALACAALWHRLRSYS